MYTTGDSADLKEQGVCEQQCKQSLYHKIDFGTSSNAAVYSCHNMIQSSFLSTFPSWLWFSISLIRVWKISCTLCWKRYVLYISAAIQLLVRNIFIWYDKNRNTSTTYSIKPLLFRSLNAYNARCSSKQISKPSSFWIPLWLSHD